MDINEEIETAVAESQQGVTEGCFRCHGCGFIYKKGWSDEECGLDAMYRADNITEAVIVCDTCYRFFETKELNEQQWADEIMKGIDERINQFLGDHQ